MKTYAQLREERIQHIVAHFNEQEATYKRGYGDRFTKAGIILATGGVERLAPDHYRVASGTSRGVVYDVNGTCPCKDSAKAPNGWCKHRLAARISNMVEQELEQLKAKHNLPHSFHRWTCAAHRSEPILCWEPVCADPIDVVCPLCTVPAPTEPDPITLALETADVSRASEMDGWEAFVGESQAYDEQPPTSVVVTAVPDTQTISVGPDDAEKAELVAQAQDIAAHEKPLEYSREQYEPAPALEKDELVPFLPEAAVSMCLTIKLPENHTITYTMRGHHDNEVLERLPGVLGTLERVLKSDVDHDSNFFQRLAHAFFPRARGAYGK